MKVILKETYDSLGIIGSEVTVADGFARNYLFPQNKAMLATDANRKMIKQQKIKVDLKIAEEKKIAQELAEKLKDVVCTISAKVSEGDNLYGSVSVRDIVNSLTGQNIEVAKKMVLLKEPIKATGEYKIPIRVYAEVEPDITVKVIPEE